MEELKKFQEKEAERRAKSKEKREAREKEEAMMAKQMEQLNRQMVQSNAAQFASGKGGAPSRSYLAEQPKEMQTKPSGMQRGAVANNKPARTG